MLRTSSTTSRSTVGRLLAVGVACSAVLALTAPLTVEPAEAAAPKVRKSTTIGIDGRSNRGAVRPDLLGVNHRYARNGHGMWDAVNDRPHLRAVKHLRRAGVSMVRYPGGIVGNLFDWKKAVGTERGCQTNGQWKSTGYSKVKGLAYGVDEHMELVDAIDGKAVLMVPFATETPADAADWVEYMNTPAGDGHNPNGGVDWAELRKENGHSRPYGVRLWEVGNEQRVKRQRYWMSSSRDRALRQYAFGGSVARVDEPLGKNCRHPNTGVRSNGHPGQVFQLLYPPAAEGSVRVSVGTDPLAWTEGSLGDAGPDDRVYEVDEAAGLVTFGDGEHGEVLPAGVKVHASYTSQHRGVFSFIKAMKEVDPRIDVCVTWGLREFVRVAGRRDYDCFSAHAYTNFGSEGTHRWGSAAQGHDRHMLATRSERYFIADLKQALPAGVPIALTEFGAIWGNSKAYPEWDGSMTRATYMASMWVNWLDLGIPWALGSDMLAPTHRGMLGHAPYFTFSAEALTRQAIKPMFGAGGRRLSVKITRNPVRNPRLGAGTYPALAVAATRGRNRDMYVLVVNRLPGSAQRVRATLNLGRFASRRVAFVSRVNGSSFRSWNVRGQTEVRLRTGRQRIGRNRFSHVFPPHSVTVLRIPSR